MQIPLEVSFRDVEHTDQLDQLIEQQASRLDKFHNHIMGCRIAVEQPQEHISHGRPWRVRLDITVPHANEVVVIKDPGKGEMHEPLEAVIRDAFDTAERNLKGLKEQQRYNVKENTMDQAVGIVSKILRDDGYGFIRDPSEQDVYFHKNAVLENDFDRIEEGTAVWYVAEVGDDGLQATSVRIHDKPSM
jgi:cold shock CspA family protein/ribosome-associated translation inhibitor RaiA